MKTFPAPSPSAFASLSSLLSVVLGGALCSIAVTGCHRDDDGPTEPVATDTAETSSPDVVSTTRPAPYATVPGCDLVVAAESPAAVGDPCMTTDKFIDSLTAISDGQKDTARRLVAESERLLEMPGTRLAH